ncbi:MAG: D-alanine--D-alanine ligase [Candidatus Taylorbacteria bacterium]|nr:D-alanine--D-alanine ligase [Candidatus Taylorbacteria bacterium]
MTHLTRVGVLRGGPSDEYEVSLKSGATVLRHLSPDKYHVIDIFIDRDGLWHIAGMPKEPHDALSQVDIIVNALHGQYGEDGKVQAILDRHGIPYTGSGSLASAIAMNKALTKKVIADHSAAEGHGVKMAKHVLISRDDIIDEFIGDVSAKALEKKLLDVFKSFALPVVVKPVGSGSSVGVSVVKGFHEFEEAVMKAFESGSNIMIEEFIPGVEGTCAVIDDFRGSEIYALPPIEIRPTHGKFFDYEAKYQGKSEEIVPGNFTHEQKDEMMRIATLVHKALGLKHYSRCDFIVTPRLGIYFLEVNTLPGLTEASLLPKGLAAVGVKMGDFLDHLVGLAISGK